MRKLLAVFAAGFVLIALGSTTTAQAGDCTCATSSDAGKTCCYGGSTYQCSCSTDSRGNVNCSLSNTGQKC